MKGRRHNDRRTMTIREFRERKIAGARTPAAPATISPRHLRVLWWLADQCLPCDPARLLGPLAKHLNCSHAAVPALLDDMTAAGLLHFDHRGMELTRRAEVALDGGR